MKVRVVKFRSVANWKWIMNQSNKTSSASNATTATTNDVPIMPSFDRDYNSSSNIRSQALLISNADDGGDKSKAAKEEKDMNLYDDENENENEEEDDCCPICRRFYDLSCPDCKHPGEDCPIMSGPNCKHSFHLHCIYKWITQQGIGKQHCPMCREPWEFDQ